MRVVRFVRRLKRSVRDASALFAQQFADSHAFNTNSEGAIERFPYPASHHRVNYSIQMVTRTPAGQSAWRTISKSSYFYFNLLLLNYDCSMTGFNGMPSHR